MKAKHNCWTCKERKVGCDRALPICINCKRSGRNCQGYGIKLSWPDKYDGRRKQKKYQSALERPANYITQEGIFSFLNTTYDDLSGEKINFKDIIRRKWNDPIALRIIPVKPIYDLQGQDGLLLSYWDKILARMVTTVDDNSNGFRLDLIPMALSSSDAASRSLLEATLALSSFHLGRPEEALQHKTSAIQSLSESFQGRNASRLAQLAACMMLCVYSVFDVSDTTWHLHLKGAKTITGSLTERERQMECFEFIGSWVDYHDTFSGYSHSVPPPLLNGIPNIVLPDSNINTQKIIGLLGCSTELLRLIACINQMRSLTDSPDWKLPSASRVIHEISLLLRSRLQNLNQVIEIAFGEKMGTIDQQRITYTAELYRIATLLYLYEVAPREAIPDVGINDLVREGLQVMDSMEVVTSPWPLFIVACNVTSDFDRLKTLAFLDTADRKRKIGNYQLIKNIIHSVWKQQDLNADEKVPARVDWRTLIDPSFPMPSFI